MAGPEADARAFLLLRPYLKRAVRVEITDPADPAPYWLVSSRRPDELAGALHRLTGTTPSLTAWVLSGHGIGQLQALDGLLAGQRPRRRAAARKGLNTSWKAATGKNPPENPADPDVDVWEAVAWAIVSGVAIGVARMLAQRKAASYYARSTGHLPPGRSRRTAADRPAKS